MSSTRDRDGQGLIVRDGEPATVLPPEKHGLTLGQRFENRLTGALYTLRTAFGADPKDRFSWRWISEVLAELGQAPMTLQRGTGVLTDNVSALNAATITPDSKILVSRRDPLGTTIGNLVVTSSPTDRVVGPAGVGGGFIVRSVDDANAPSVDDDSTFDWAVIN
jgi:hypothetical protein